MSDNPVDPGATHRFRLVIDGVDLGVFTGCTGLSCTVEVEEYAEGGRNDSMWYLPKRVRFPPLALTRPLTAEAEKTSQWVLDVVNDSRQRTGHIAALSASSTIVAKWDLLNVVPISWSGPNFDVSAPTVATEVLEIVHHGFFKAGTT
ncbi:phage tail protein [Streptomyces kronopolitis]|uniref:phage tail protein n=1 Tax=Streptomyces kronopolitis TaxID=1612435 RepID=UPI0020BE6C39|nr:phage tail protein [Streptomyces kronopolitis]MCL6302586.1 phage tail protein [Streptomyces kronopolitis]